MKNNTRFLREKFNRSHTGFKISQEEIADLIERSRQYYSDIELQKKDSIDGIDMFKLVLLFTLLFDSKLEASDIFLPDLSKFKNKVVKFIEQKQKEE